MDWYASISDEAVVVRDGCVQRILMDAFVAPAGTWSSLLD